MTDKKKPQMSEVYRRWLLSGYWTTYIHLDYYETENIG